MKFHVVLNPAGASGGAAKLWKKVKPSFENGGCTYQLHCSSPRHGIEEICREITSGGEDAALVIIGGDGSVNEAVNGIADLEHTALGFIPCGTGNDMRRDMDIPLNSSGLPRP